MGYVPPFIPVQTIQYQNRINFSGWRSVPAVGRTMKAHPNDANHESIQKPMYNNLSKGKKIDRFI